jgi:maleate cis-trans isomerase
MIEAPPDIRLRIGLIIPSSNRLTEPQMRRYAPPDIEIHVTRLRMTGAHHAPLQELLPRIADATAALADARCDAVVFHCTASAMEAGPAGSQLVEETMRAAAPGSEVATAESARAPQADAIFLSCTNTHTPQVIEPLESASRRSVITSNQAVLWYALRQCQQSDTIDHLGRLFQLGIAPRSPADAQPAAVA